MSHYYKVIVHHAKTERQTQRKTDTDEQTDRDTNKQAERQTNRQTETQTDKQTERQTNRQTETQTNRQRDRQTERQTHRQRYTEEQPHGPLWSGVKVWHCLTVSWWQKDKQADRHLCQLMTLSGRQTHRQRDTETITNRQTIRQKDRQTDNRYQLMTLSGWYLYVCQ